MTQKPSCQKRIAAQKKLGNISKGGKKFRQNLLEDEL